MIATNSPFSPRWVSLLFVSLAAIFTLTATPSASRSPAAEAPLGLWMAELDETRPPAPISISRRGSNWSAHIGDMPIPVRTSADGTVTVTTERGEKFTGRTNADGSAITGIWVEQPNRFGYAEMATPTRLNRTQDGSWAGTLTSQPRPYRVYLNIFEKEDGTVAAIIRNPERNEVQRALGFSLASQNDDWILKAGSGEQSVERRLQLENDGTVLLEHSRFEKPLRMTRVEDDQALGFFARPPSQRTGRMTPPEALSDGWDIASPAEAGFDKAALDRLVAELETTDPRASRPQLLHSLLVAREGKLVLEEYFHGYDRQTPHDIRSLGKVWASVLIGALQQQNVSIDASTRPIGEVLENANEPLDDPQKLQITLADLMTYSSGLDCDDNGVSRGSEDQLWAQQEEASFWVYAAKLPVLFKPAERYAYCGASVNLVGAAIRSAGDAPVLTQLDELIARPLKFSPYHWNMMPDGEAYLGGGAYIRPRDILKLGALYAAEGVWKGQRIIPKEWIAESTAPKIAVTPQTTGLSPSDFSNAYFPSEQAYVWRVHDIEVEGRRFRSYENNGNGGQVLVIVPELDLAVAYTGGNYLMGYIWARWRDEIVGGHIIPATTDIPDTDR